MQIDISCTRDVVALLRKSEILQIKSVEYVDGVKRKGDKYGMVCLFCFVFMKILPCSKDTQNSKANETVYPIYSI